MKHAPFAALAAVVFANLVLAGCACESSMIRGDAVWSAAPPKGGVLYSRTTNLLPFYSKNLTFYGDRIEESGTAMLFISWSKTTARRMSTVQVEGPQVKVEATETGMAAPAAMEEASETEAQSGE
jgi:hypothetical protein